MPDESQRDLAQWARGHWPGGDPGEAAIAPLPVDGSPRRFYRLEAGGLSLVLMESPDNPPELAAWLYLAGHLGAHGLPVPRVLAADREAGRVLMEDLGRRCLQEMALERIGDEEALFAIYDPVLAVLARLQVQGGLGLDTAFCFDGAALDPAFLRQREAGYFLAEFVAGACGIAPEKAAPGVGAELDDICRRAGQAEPWGFVHRDFNSRNIMARPAGQGPGLVDFQGGRLGPAQYDLAALLHDPYLDLPWGLRARLLDRYIERRAHIAPLDVGALLEGWPYVSLSRVMQALGAYAFLTRKRGRAHFAAYARPALMTLRRLLAAPPLNGYAALTALAAALPAQPGPELFSPQEGAPA